MKEFRLKMIKKRWLFISLNFIAMIIINLSSIYGHPTYNNNNMNSIIQGFRIGICLGMEIVLLYQIRSIVNALKNENDLRKLYIKENDERNKFISRQTSSIGYSIALFGMALAVIISSFFNIVVCITLLLATLFLIVIILLLYFYYHKKY